MAQDSILCYAPTFSLRKNDDIKKSGYARIGYVTSPRLYLKIRIKSDEELRKEFRSVLAQARAIAAERGITEAEIAEEIQRGRS